VLEEVKMQKKNANGGYPHQNGHWRDPRLRQRRKGHSGRLLQLVGRRASLEGVVGRVDRKFPMKRKAGKTRVGGEGAKF